MKRLTFAIILTICICSCSDLLISTPSSFVDQPEADENAVFFVAFGDHGTGNTKQYLVGSALSELCLERSCDFVTLLGDNFYPNGVDSVNDPLFQTVFEEPYSEIDISFYPALGNHDYGGNIQAQINYSEISEKWVMPDRIYTHSHPDNENPLIEFFVIDSNNFTEEDEQWLQEAIDDSSATWKVLQDHHPIISSGNHGDDDANIAERLVPIICDSINLVLSGHDHSKEHLIGTSQGCSINQIILGTGGAGLHNISPDNRTLFASRTYGFGWFQVNSTEIYVEFLNTENKPEYSELIEP